jgi:hypothetical protein
MKRTNWSIDQKQWERHGRTLLRFALAPRAPSSAI